MFVRQINARLSRNASEIDENVLEYLSEAHLDLKSGLSIASLLSLREICEDPRIVERLLEPEIIKDCAILSQTLAEGLGNLHKQYETVQHDSFTMEQVLKKAISDLQAALETSRTRERELIALTNELREQLRNNNDLYEKRISKAREHLTALGVFSMDCREDSVDLSSESSFAPSSKQSMSRNSQTVKENQIVHQRSFSGFEETKTRGRSRAGPYVAQVISASKNKSITICSEIDSQNSKSWTRPLQSHESEQVPSSHTKPRDRSRHFH